MTSRMRYNFDAIRGLLKADGTRAAVLSAARSIDAKVAGEGLQSRIDIEDGPLRPRAAVIAGYEDGATAERTRKALLRALDGG